jgi:hypothetical protein
MFQKSWRVNNTEGHVLKVLTVGCSFVLLCQSWLLCRRNLEVLMEVLYTSILRRSSDQEGEFSFLGVTVDSSV